MPTPSEVPVAGRKIFSGTFCDTFGTLRRGRATPDAEQADEVYDPAWRMQVYVWVSTKKRGYVIAEATFWKFRVPGMALREQLAKGNAKESE
jgi:hypothetical protein